MKNKNDPDFEKFRNESFRLSDKIVEYAKKVVNNKNPVVICATLLSVSIHFIKCCCINERLYGGQDQLNTFISGIIVPTIDRLKSEYYVNSQEGYIR